MTPYAIDYLGLPDSLRGGVQRYIEHGVPPGSFLEAVISNDASEAVRRADLNNRRMLVQIIEWFQQNAPGECWGSAKRYSDWLAKFER